MRTYRVVYGIWTLNSYIQVMMYDEPIVIHVHSTFSYTYMSLCNIDGVRLGETTIVIAQND